MTESYRRQYVSESQDDEKFDSYDYHPKERKGSKMWSNFRKRDRNSFGGLMDEYEKGGGNFNKRNERDWNGFDWMRE